MPLTTAKREIANCVLAAVYIPMELWASFYNCVEWQNIACTNTPHVKLVCILNVSNKIFEQLIHQNEPGLLWMTQI